MNQNPEHIPLKLIAESAADLEVMAASLQDAIVKVSDIVFSAQSHTLTMRALRYMHETSSGRRVVCALRLNHILSVQTKGIDRSDPDAFLVLLTLAFQKKGRSSAGTVELVFAGGGNIKAEVEYIETRLVDIEPPRTAKNTPLHPLDV